MNYPALNPAFKLLIAEIERYYPMCSTAFKVEIQPLLFEIDLKKDKRILNYKEIQDTAYFIFKGSARELWVDPITLEERTTRFWFEKDFPYTNPGLFNRSPSPCAIELMEDSKLLGMLFNDFLALKNEFPEAELLSENIRGNYAQLQREYEADLGIPAIHRIQKLEAQHPNIYNIADVQHIADYLRINRETLRRLRGR